MKKLILKLFSVAFILALAAACVPEEYGSTFEYSAFVQVTTPTVSVSEDADPATATVKVQYVGPKLTQDLTINLGVTLTGPGDDVTLPGNSVVVKAGEFTATTIVTFSDNLVNDGNKVISINILSTSSADIAPATPDTKKDKAVVTIVDNDCPFDVSEFEGSYSLTGSFLNSFLYEGDVEFPVTFVLVAGDEPNTLVDNDFLYLSDGGDAVPATIKLDPETLTATLVGESITFGDASTDDNAVYLYNDAPNRRFAVNDTETGPGAVSTCSKSITINALIRREDGSTPQVFTLTYTKQ